MSRYAAMFERLDGEGAFGAFLMLGDPDLQTSARLLDAVIEGGADMIEVGIPFSDPVADGPVIQAAAQRALAAGVRVGDCLDLIAGFRARHPHVPVGILTYGNIVLARSGFMRDAAEAGADSLLLADVPALEAEPFVAEMEQAGIVPVLIAAPNTPDATLERIAQLSKAYTYCVSRAGITGTHACGRFDSGLVQRLCGLGAPPQVFGFGISKPEHVRAALSAGAKGVICGSAIVESAALGGDVTALVRLLKGATGNDSASQRIESPREGEWQMAARAIWRGQIRLALVSIPIELFPATKSGAQIQFHQVYEPTGQRIKYEKVVPGIGPVDRDQIVKGYEVSKGHYVLLDQEEIDSVKLESRKTLDLVEFVDEDGIDPMYFDKPYYVVPADDLAEEAYVVLRDALKAANKIGVGQLAMRGQEYVVALKPCGRGLLLETLRYADEVNKSSGFFRDIGDTKPDPDLLDMASMLIERKAGEFDPKEFHNRYVDALHRLIEKKQKAKGAKVIEEPEEAAPKGSNVIDLMAALKKSLGEQKGGKAEAKRAPAKKAPAKKAPAKKAAAGGRKR